VRREGQVVVQWLSRLLHEKASEKQSQSGKERRLRLGVGVVREVVTLWWWMGVGDEEALGVMRSGRGRRGAVDRLRRDK
jgi:hypothetical protein